MAENIELRRARQRAYTRRKRLGDRLTRKVGSRVIVCPSSYVVVMVPADRVAQLI